MFGMSVIHSAEVLIILGIILLTLYVMYRLNLFKKD